ncbi:hypothetical protein FXO38_21224 [Capsicum annuum]|nr:hypothetical protein FXO38_21224 [Capsicum annuum]
MPKSSPNGVFLMRRSTWVMESVDSTITLNLSPMTSAQFEHILASILNHNLTSLLNSILLNLLAEETRMVSLSSLSSPSNSFASYKGKYHGLSTTECFNCHDKGPYASHYRNQTSKLFCRYCKKDDGSFFSLPIDFVQQLIKVLHAASFGKPKPTTPWIIDSGATHYMTGDLTIFTSSKPSLVPDTITVANGMNLDIQRSVTLKFIFPDSPLLVLSDFLYVPKLSANLISVNQLVDKHFFISFSPNSCLIQDLRIGKVILQGRRQGELFILDLGSLSNSHKFFLAPYAQEVNLVNALWKQLA